MSVNADHVGANRENHFSRSHDLWFTDQVNPRFGPLVASLLAFIYSAFGIKTPSFWVDEAATISAISRSSDDLWRMLGNIDAVHGFYYLLMKPWADTVGFTEAWLRLPSAIAIGLSAGFLYALARRLGGSPYAAVATAIFIILPRVQYTAIDARSYSLTILGALAATYLLIRLRDHPSWLGWLGYGLVGSATVLASFYTILLLFAHLAFVLSDRSFRRQLRWFGLAGILWVAAALVVGLISVNQQFQISWIRPIDGSVAFEVFFMQFFSDGYMLLNGSISPASTPGEDFTMYALAALIWLFAVLGVWRLVKDFRLRLILPWLLLPLIAVICGSLVLGTPYYLPRYLCFILPTLPLLAAAAFFPRKKATNGRVRWTALVAVLLMIVVSLPSYLGQRTEFGKSPNDDFRFIADTMCSNAKPGEAFVVSTDLDLAYQAYPKCFKGLEDPTIGITAAEWGRIFDQRFDVLTARAKVLENPVVWVVLGRTDGTISEQMESLGYRSTLVISGPASKVAKFER
jgi:mannosyltransferase